MLDEELQEMEPIFIHHPPNYRLLLIDDDFEQRRMVEAMLSRAGYNVYTAASATEGIRKLAKQRFDMAICDLRMPDIDGFEFVERVRALESDPRSVNLPIIILTGCGGELELAALQAGADIYCDKRYASTTLLSQIQFLLSFG